MQPGTVTAGLAIHYCCTGDIDNTGHLSVLCPPKDANRIGSSPVGPFPYKRLATTARPSGSFAYLYHQLDDSTIVEDYAEKEIGGWMSSKINITTA